MKEYKGFSLIELMIVLVVVGVLAAIAFPSYMQYMRRSVRAEAQTHMMDIAGRQGQFLIDNRAYAGSVGALGITTPSSVSTKYTIGIATEASPPTYTITATPVSGSSQASDSCGTLSLNSAGAKTASGTGTCW